MLIRLNKYLSDSGCCSRRKADEYISAGDIEVNGKTTRELGTKVDPAKDIVKFKGKIVKAPEKFVYYALYKPKGVVSTADDELGRQTVIDLVPKSPRVYPVGRLDESSEGLIILTNDGELTQELTHPGFAHEKEYEIKVENPTLSTDKQKSKVKNLESIKKIFETGLTIDGHIMRAFNVQIAKDPLNFKLLTLKLVLRTGYNRQIRRMCAKIGLAVICLTRTKVANLSLSELNLTIGKYKTVKKDEIV